MPSPEDTTETNPRRTFTIADGMILVAAAAMALADPGLTGFRLEPGRLYVLRRVTWACLSFTIALMTIRLRRPRPGRDELWRQPGWVACVWVAISSGAFALDCNLWIARFAFFNGRVPDGLAELYLNAFGELSCRAPIIVASAWGTLALSGRWEAERSWIDRAGRLVGLSWIALYLACLLRN
jgi:hypothetical protein